MKKLLRIALALTLLVTVAYWGSFKAGWIRPSPGLFAGLVALLMAVLAAGAALDLPALVRLPPGRVRALARNLLRMGLLVALGAGMANWLYGLQGMVVLTEQEAVALSQTDRLQAFDAGPLSDLGEMRLMVKLEAMDLRTVGAAGFTPSSTLRVARRGAQAQELTVSPGHPATLGSIRFYQGAFGFAPRIVLLRDERTLLDRFVPFTTRRTAAQGLSFTGTFEVEREGLLVEGAVDLDSLDEQMRGHPTLHLSVRRGEAVLGSGDLLPGHFADISEGYRIGFAGLKKWSEIDISRRNYPLPIFAGFGMVALGALLWPIAVWRKW